MGATNAGIDTNEIDWTGCEVIQHISGKVSGKPVVGGTRIVAGTIVQDAELGSTVAESHENYPDLSISTIQQLTSLPNRFADGP